MLISFDLIVLSYLAFSCLQSLAEDQVVCLWMSDYLLAGPNRVQSHGLSNARTRRHRYADHVCHSFHWPRITVVHA